MKLRKTPFLVLALVLLASLPAFAEEGNLLERLNAETTKLAEKARAATVHISQGYVTSEAVLVGRPPRLVTAYESIGKFETVQFVLPNGTSGHAKRVVGDRELDVAVYALPENVSVEAWALTPAEGWQHPAGTIAVLGGTRPRLLLTRGSHGPRDGLRLEDDDATGPLLAADGRLLGFRPRVSQTPGAYTWYGTLQGAISTQTATQLRTTTIVTGKDGYYYLVPPQPAAGQPQKGGKDAKGQVEDEKDKPHELFVTPRVVNIKPTVVSLYTPPTGPASVLTPKSFLPGALIRRVLADLDARGRVRHAYLGVVPAPAEKGMGARLSSVLPDSPAAKAELKPGDVITAVNGEPVKNVAAFTRQLVLRVPGDAITLLVTGRKQPVRIVLAEQAEARRELPTPKTLGFETVGATPELTAFLGMSDVKAGVAVRAVTPNTAAARAGLRRGDVIVKGGGNPTRDLEELLAALASAKGRVALTVRREGVQGEQLLHLLLPSAKARPAPR